MLCHYVVEIPDEEDIDNRLEAEVTYHSMTDRRYSNHTVTGYIEPYNPIDTSKLHISELHVDDKSVIVFRYPVDTDVDDARLVREILQAEFPNNKVIGLTDDIDILSQYPDEAIPMLEKMIAHIKIVNI